MTRDPEDPLAEARRALLQDGACHVPGVFRKRWLDRVRAGLDACISSPSGGAKTWTDPRSGGRFFQDAFAWNRIETLREFVFESPAAGLLSRLLGSSEIRLYMDHLLVRDPETDMGTPWHHDTPYCFVDGDDFCTLWLPLDPVPLGQGLRLVRGSHRWNRMFLPVEFASNQGYRAAPDAQQENGASAIPDIDAGDHEILSWAVEPGDCIVFYCSMLHSAPPHRVGDRGRRVYSTRWIGRDARFADRAWSVPPFPQDPGLKPGDRFDGPLFPRIV